MSTYRGSCHCGRVAFEVEAKPTHLVRCNCSLCARKGALYLPVGEISSVTVLSGESDLVPYSFNTRTATHFFCRTCGIHAFHKPRIDPSRWSVNARCLEGGPPDLPIEQFDGQNWQASARAEGWSG